METASVAATIRFDWKNGNTFEFYSHFPLNPGSTPADDKSPANHTDSSIAKRYVLVLFSKNTM